MVAPFLTTLAGQLRTGEVTPTFELSTAVLGLLAAGLAEQLGSETNVSPETRRHGVGFRLATTLALGISPTVCSLRPTTAALSTSG